MGGLLARPLVRSSPEQEADAIVVLGARLLPDGELTAALDERVRAGVALWHRGLAPRLIATGGGPPGREEAVAMAARARRLGVADDAVSIEQSALNTADNARFVAAMLEPGARVWLVTQPFHTRRAAFWFRRVGLIPLAWHIEDSLQYQNPRSGLRWAIREYGAWVKLVVGGF
jgi:uncharacterized SAM-binding protein YcdF (DUF218 family)